MAFLDWLRGLMDPAPRRYGGVIAGKGSVTTLAQVTVGTTAVQLLPFNGNRRVALLGTLAANTAPIYVGGTNAVTTATGTQLTAGAALTDSEGEGAWWAISSAAAQTATVLEIS